MESVYIGRTNSILDGPQFPEYIFEIYYEKENKNTTVYSIINRQMRIYKFKLVVESKEINMRKSRFIGCYSIESCKEKQLNWKKWKMILIVAKQLFNRQMID